MNDLKYANLEDSYEEQSNNEKQILSVKGLTAHTKINLKLY